MLILIKCIVCVEVYLEVYAITLDPYNKERPLNNHDLWTQSNRVFNDSAKSKIAAQKISVEGAKLWNMAPLSVTKATSIKSAKSAIKILVKSFPV